MYKVNLTGHTYFFPNPTERYQITMSNFVSVRFVQLGKPGVDLIVKCIPVGHIQKKF